MKSTDTVEVGRIVPENLQVKVAALESTLFRSIKESDDRTSASILIQREPSEALIIGQAIDRLLSRLKINAEVVSKSIEEGLLVQGSSSTKPSLYRFKISSGRDQNLKRVVEILISAEKILIKIGGWAPIDGEKEEIAEIYFQDPDLPGKKLADGTIDFRELNRYPTVSRDDALMRVRSAEPCREGITFDGKPIPAAGIAGNRLKLKEGVTRMDLSDDDESPREYLVMAARDGVVLLDKEEESIVGIEVNNMISLKQIDYSVGNIGSEVLCPVSMNIGLIQSGFKVNVNGEVNVKDLDGGTVVTNSNATFDQIQKNSEVRASGNIATNTVISSSLSAETGGIIVKKEMRDSKLTAARVEIRNSEGMLANVDVDADNLDILNVAIGGTNSVNLGKHLFQRRDRLLLERVGVDKLVAGNDKTTNEIKGKLFEWLKKLSDRISTDEGRLRDDFKALLETLRLSTFDDTYPILEDLKGHLHQPTVEQVKKQFILLEKHLEKIEPVTRRAEAVKADLADTVKKINNIGFEIRATLRPTASIEILCHDEKPFLILPDPNKAEEFIRYSGHYTLKGGLTIKKM